MRRPLVLLLTVVAALGLASCSSAPTPEERQATLRTQIEAVDGVAAAKVSGYEVVVGAEEGLSAEDSQRVLDEVHSLVLASEDPEDLGRVAFLFSGPGDQEWRGVWESGAIVADEFTQQADFLASLSGWDGIAAADAPITKLELGVSDLSDTTAEDPQVVGIDVYDAGASGGLATLEYVDAGEPATGARAELLQLWLSSGGASDQMFQWRVP
ncbi:hypothetical protein AB0E56_16870 [Microbacterium sp. NPDC028030]|uniref:hypothetical protein n=1 Tax=Microbacterium sp. NPDC028030 TaxID=3155124 RepID=UPI0033C838EF